MDQLALCKFFKQLTKSEIENILFVDKDILNKPVIFTINYLVLITYNILYHDDVLNAAYIYIHDTIKKIFSPFNSNIKNNKKIIQNAKNRKMTKYDFVINYVRRDKQKIMSEHYYDYFKKMYDDMINIRQTDTTYTVSKFNDYMKNIEVKIKKINIQNEIDHVIKNFYLKAVIKFSSRCYIKKISNICRFFQTVYTDEIIHKEFSNDTFKKGYEFEKHINNLFKNENNNIFFNCVLEKPIKSIKAEFDVVIGEIIDETIQIKDIYEIKSNTHNVADDLEKMINGMNHFSRLKIENCTYMVKKMNTSVNYIVAQKQPIFLTKSENEIFKIILDFCRKNKETTKNILNCIEIVNDIDSTGYCRLNLTNIYSKSKQKIVKIIDECNTKMKIICDNNDLRIYEYVMMN